MAPFLQAGHHQLVFTGASGIDVVGNSEQALLLWLYLRPIQREELKINTGEQTCAGSSNQRTWIHQLIMMARYTESCLSSPAWALAVSDASGNRAPFPISFAFTIQGVRAALFLCSPPFVCDCIWTSGTGYEKYRWSPSIEYLISSADHRAWVGGDRRSARG